MPQYGSKFKAFRVNIRSEIKKWHPTMDVVMETIPEMVAEFGVHRPEVEVETTSGVERFGDISGYFYDLDADAKAKGWNDEEYAIALKRLDDLCETWPEAIWKLEDLAPTAPRATYDKMDYAKVASFALELGLASEALANELATKNRKSVVKALQDSLAATAAEEKAPVNENSATKRSARTLACLIRREVRMAVAGAGPG